MRSLDEPDLMPPELLRARQRREHVKTAIAFAFLGTFAAAHVDALEARSITIELVGAWPAWYLHGPLISMVVLARLGQFVRYRRELARSRRDYMLEPGERSGVQLTRRVERLATSAPSGRADLAAIATRRVTMTRRAGGWCVFTAASVGVGLLGCGWGSSAASGLSLLVVSLAAMGMAVGLGAMVSTGRHALDARATYRRVRREREVLRELRRELSPDELTGALTSSASIDPEHVGALSTVASAELTLFDSDA